MTEKKKLGRGLSALLGEASAVPASAAEKTVRSLPVGSLRPGVYQPRHVMRDEAIEELAKSIREKGVLQPLLVRRDPRDPAMYEIIAGERRWRAAQRARLHDVPVIVKDLTDKETLEVALIENLQREDLSPIEEAQGFERLMKEFEHTQEALAAAVGRSRSHVANTMRLLSLPTPVQKMIEDGDLSAGHARPLVGRDDAEALAREIVRKGLNVRQAEKLATRKPRRPEAGRPVKDADTVDLERRLSEELGLKVDIRQARKGGSLIVHYNDLDQLEDVVARLGGSAGPR